MENSTAESVLEKTFDHLDKIIEEKKQDKSLEVDTHVETEDPREQRTDETDKMVERNE